MREKGKQRREGMEWEAMEEVRGGFWIFIVGGGLKLTNETKRRRSRLRAVGLMRIWTVEIRSNRFALLFWCGFA